MNEDPIQKKKKKKKLENENLKGNYFFSNLLDLRMSEQ